MNEFENNTPQAQQSTDTSGQGPAQYTAYNPYTYSGAYHSQKPREKRTYTKNESICALCIFFLSFLFCRTFPFGSYPLGNLIVGVLALVLVAVHMTAEKSKYVPPLSYLFLIFGAAFCISPLFCSNFIVVLLCYAAFGISVLLFMYFSRQNGVGAPSSEYLLFDTVRAVFALPLSNGANAVSAAIQPAKHGRVKEAGKHIVYILLGLVIAFVPCVFVLANLSFESKFTQLLSDIFDFGGIEEVFGYAASALFSIPIALYLFSAVWQYANTDKSPEAREKLRADYNNNKATVRILPSLTVVTSALPLMFLYVVFFISQLEDYTAAFKGVLPDGYIYSEYARNGFFELCRVAGLNALFILCSTVVVKRRGEKISIVQRIVTALLCLCSLVLIATAMSKMSLYISAYGMTQKRVYTSLFMLLLAVGFAVTLIAQFATKIKMTWVTLVLAALMLLLPAYTNIDSHIASYNVDRYMDSTSKSVDYSAFSDYEEAALPALARLYVSDRATEADKRYIETIAISVRAEYKHTKDSIFRYNIPRHNAERAIECILGADEN